MSPLLEHAKPRLIVGGSYGDVATKRDKRPLAEGAWLANTARGAHNRATGASATHGRRNRKTRQSRLRPQLVHSLPAQPVEGPITT
jgi:hypothetical protein